MGATASSRTSPNGSAAMTAARPPTSSSPPALAACVSTTLLMYARTKDWNLGDLTVDVEYDHQSTPRQFQVAIKLGGDLSDAQLERLEKVASACPLRRSIEAGIEFLETIECRGTDHRHLRATG